MECSCSSELWQWLWRLSGLRFHSRSYLDLDVNIDDLGGFMEDHFGLSIWAAHTFFLHLFLCSGRSSSTRPICMVHRIFYLKMLFRLQISVFIKVGMGDSSGRQKVVFLGLVGSLETRHLIVAPFSRLSSHESTNLLLATTQFIGLNVSLPLVEEVGSYIRVCSQADCN